MGAASERQQNHDQPSKGDPKIDLGLTQHSRQQCGPRIGKRIHRVVQVHQSAPRPSLNLGDPGVDQHVRDTRPHRRPQHAECHNNDRQGQRFAPSHALRERGKPHRANRAYGREKHRHSVGPVGRTAVGLDR